MFVFIKGNYVPRKKLGIPNQVAQMNFEGLGDAGQGVDRNGLFHAFYLADVFGIQVGEFTEPFLGHFRLFPILANGVGQ